MRKEFRESINTALHNPNLTGALGRFSEAYRISREKAYEGIDFEAVRTQIAERKGYAASHLDELAELFTQQAEARGAKVFRTDDPAKVREYILELAQRNGVKSIVKSKSMASEEIHLNPYLEKAGIEVRETDLGEWIVQLAKQTPSHMVMPAIHMTKEEVAETSSARRSRKVRSRTFPKLVKFAREKLRTKFLRRDGDHRSEHRSSGDRNPRHRHQRRQRAPGDNAAENPRSHCRPRETDGEVRRRCARADSSAQERHRRSCSPATSP
jgi:L-lactate dehydrogenase complex protein LldF